MERKIKIVVLHVKDNLWNPQEQPRTFFHLHQRPSLKPSPWETVFLKKKLAKFEISVKKIK